MKSLILISTLFLSSLYYTIASPIVDSGQFGRDLGGWEHKGDKAAEYEIHGSKYRTWMPEITQTVAGGLFVSIRIDHMRGLFSSDDHASLELEFDKNERLVGAKSTVVFQGESQKGEVIRATAKAGSSIMGVEAAVQIGADLVSDISAKILKNKKNEPGRVTMPAVIRHNYNLLCLASGITSDGEKAGKKSEPTKKLKIEGQRDKAS